MDTLKSFTTDELRAALARAWSTDAAIEIQAEIDLRNAVLIWPQYRGILV